MANIYPGFLRKRRTMSVAIQCVHNSSCPMAQMLPAKPRAPSYESCPARQRIMLAAIFFASSLPPLCISVRHRSLGAGDPDTQPETQYWEDGGLSFRLTRSCHWGEQDNATNTPDIIPRSLIVSVRHCWTILSLFKFMEGHVSGLEYTMCKLFIGLPHEQAFPETTE